MTQFEKLKQAFPEKSESELKWLVDYSDLPLVQISARTKNIRDVADSIESQRDRIAREKKKRIWSEP